MTRLIPRSLTVVVGMVVVAGTACDPAAVLHRARELARDGNDKGGSPGPENPCNLVDCKPGYSCVVLESDPPQASCQPDAPQTHCYANEDCRDGLVCSVSLGECASPPDCDPDGPCDSVCTGTCVKPEPQPIDNPCAVTLCPRDTACVILKTYPPRAECVPVEPKQTCYATTDCAPGKTCSLERGDCQPHPGCKDGQACPAVCVGVCEDAPPPGSCRTDSDCKLHSNYCGGCSCEAVGPDSGVAACSDPVQCFADPCQDKRAVCSAGTCTVASREETCDTQVMGGDTSCKPDDVWRRYVTEACGGGTVKYLGFGRECDGGHREVKYTCCR